MSEKKESGDDKFKNILEFLTIQSTTGDVIDSKPVNHDLKYASYFPTPGVDSAVGPYEDEDDKIFFFGEEDVESEALGVSDESQPKVNYANKRDRFVTLKKIYRKVI